MKSIWRRAQVAVLGSLASLILAALYRTVRWKRNELHSLNEHFPFIAAFWHADQLMLAPLFGAALPAGSTSVLISAHTDGRIIARAIRAFGLSSVAGSSTRGGSEAFRELVSLLKAGKSVAITPDGPRGPRHQVKRGVIRLSRLTGLPIYPMTYAASRRWEFKSWDRMFLPKPFSTGICLVGAPMVAGSDDDDAADRAKLEQRLRELSFAASEALGR